MQLDDMVSVEDYVCFDNDVLTESDSFTTNTIPEKKNDSDETTKKRTKQLILEWLNPKRYCVSIG